jgi:saccharopine dehydrogenase (NAD+, L-lysine-forming)
MTATRPVNIERVAVLGLGNVGSLIADMLAERGHTVHGVDADGARGGVVMDVSDTGALTELFGDVDAVVSCLPYNLNANVAGAAHAAGIHYLDLTEDVPTSRLIRELAQTGSSAFIPHCGLAPGFICVVGASLAASLDTIERVALRVGALPRSPNNALGYAFNWSPAGVVNEYLNACERLQDGRLVSVPALGEVETIIIDGTPYEAFTTSGGLGTMCETFSGRVDRLDYKSMRYPGHCELMRFLLLELRLGRRRELAQELLAAAYPPVREDLVIVYAAAEGTRDGRAVREEFVRTYRPREIAGRMRTSIAWTTASGAVGALELLAAGALRSAGFVRQEDIALDAFLRTSAGRLMGDGATGALSEQPLVPVAEVRLRRGGRGLR